MQSAVVPATILGLVLVALSGLGCGDDSTDSASSTDTGSDSTTGDSTSTTTGQTQISTSSTNSGMTDDGSTSTTTTGVDSGSTGSSGACQVWEITYELEGSTFEITDTPFGAGDQVNTVTMPYDADDHLGPGRFVLRFEDVAGEPGGMAAMVSYEMSMHFVVNSGLTVVSTDLEADAGPDECGITTGMVADTTLTWTPSAIVGHHSMGQILCEGSLCSAGDLPDGEPVPVDEMTDQPIDDFELSPDLSSFTMPLTVISMDSNSTTAWSYVGTETGRELVDAPPCMCP